MHPDNRPKMNCEQAEALFSGLMEAALSEKEEAGLRAHMETCSRCAQGYAEFEEAMKALSSYTPAPVPQTFTDAVSSAVVSGPEPGTRWWPLVLSWALTAASVLLAAWVYLSTPKEIEVLTPVDREVVVEKIREVPVPYEVEVIKEVPVPMATAVSIPISLGGLHVVRNGNAFKVSAGESLEFNTGDEIHVVRTEPDLGERSLFDGMVIDLEPVAGAVGGAVSAVSSLSEAVDRYRRDQHLLAAMAESESENTSELKPEASSTPRSLFDDHGAVDPVTPVALIWADDDSLALETTGPDHEVIPELLRMLDDQDAKVSAVALGMLETIQQRLQREHGISPPREAKQIARKTNLLDDLRGLFDETNEEENPEFSLTEFWQRWWAVNRTAILYVACLDI